MLHEKNRKKFFQNFFPVLYSDGRKKIPVLIQRVILCLIYGQFGLIQRKKRETKTETQGGLLWRISDKQDAPMSRSISRNFIWNYR